MSAKSKIYTRTGDKGETSLFGGKRVAKTHQRIVAIGAVDELNAAIGVVASLVKTKQLKISLETIQSDLFNIGADLANPSADVVIVQTHVDFLEKAIDNLDSSLPELRNFILPGGSLEASQAQLARSIARRAEREVVKLASQEKVDARTQEYLNRLSDFFFVLSRFLNKKKKIKDIIWTRK